MGKAKIIDGKAIAARLRAAIRDEVARLRRCESRGVPDAAVFRPPISLRSMALGRTGCSASTTDNATIVCRAQHAKS